MIDAEQLKQLQAPLKAIYADNPEAAIARLHAVGVVDLNRLACEIKTPLAVDEKVVAGLHPKAGGDGHSGCSGDMLLQALVACSGVTLAAVATAMGLDISSVHIEAFGAMDFRGTLGVDRSTPVGLTAINLNFVIESHEPDEKIDKLIQLTERYCVVLQTLAHSVPVTSQRG